MKNKKAAYLLFAVAAVLWGIIFFKIYEAMDKEETPIVLPAIEKSGNVKLINHQTDTFKLDLNYRNPFESYDQENFNKESTQPVDRLSISRPSVKAKVDWSKIQYTGYINNSLAKQRIAIIVANGREFMLAQGQELNGIKLLKYTNDSIKVTYQEESRFIKLKSHD